jgi:hypothetical protein
MIIIRVGINRTLEDVCDPNDEKVSALVFSSPEAEGISATTPRFEDKYCV